MHATARTDCGMHRMHRRTNATGNTAENFSPSARQTLTNDSRQKSGACADERALDASSIVAADTPTASTCEQRHRRASSGIAVDRPTDALLSQTELPTAWHCHTEIVPRWRQRAKKNGRSESGHRMPAATKPDQCSSSSSSSA
ncbi:hypothetical protein BRN95_16635 [Xanthomonas oryzae pv. oryzae]|nr:hypothetical protein ATY45_14430 [Xanthomonas oryzae pv. oryzae]UWU53892.1 hypothetical protein BRN95_16635 [Xanthomonas oryzae pv. oryzae]UWZ69874.1 hypothetical protein BHL62_16925 [Xanthomonas oryzae pv. oryzae]